MKKNFVLAIAYLLLLLRMAGCRGYKVQGTYDPAEQSFSGVVRPDNGSAEGTCPSVPTNFKESDLIGTWEYFDNSKGDLSLILSADNTYKQIYDYAPNHYHYEGEWKKWRLERHNNGTGLVIFQDMWFCDVDCIPLQGGAVVNPCEQYETVTLRNGEVALILVGAPPPNDLNLSPDSNTIANYELAGRQENQANHVQLARLG